MPKKQLWDRSVYFQKASDLGSILDSSCKMFSTKNFLIPAEEGMQPLTFSELGDFVRGCEYFLEEKGAKVGERCAVIAQNSSSLMLLFLGIMSTGRVFVPINPNCTPDEINFIVSDSGSKLIIYENSLAEKVSFLFEFAEMIGIDGDETFIKSLCALGKQRLERVGKPKEDSIAEIVYTSGTTGSPKGVVLSHRNLIEDLFGVGELFDFSDQDRFLTVTPLFHNSGQIVTTLIPLYCGGTTTVIRTDMGFINFWHYVEHFRPTWTLVMPSHVVLMLDRDRKPSNQSLRGIFCGGAKIPRDTLLSFEKRFSVPIFNSYGLTESTCMSTCVRPDDANRASGSTGHPLTINQIKIVNDGCSVEPGDVGEICISGDNIFVGYVNRDDLYQEKVVNGWLHTGDLGYFDKNGLHIVDRIDNMINVGGENVYPADVERYVPYLQGIKEAVLSSVPESMMGRELILIFQLAKDATANEKLWKAALYKKLSSYKVPLRFINICELDLTEIPKTQSGKIQRKKLEVLLVNHCCSLS